MGTRDASSDRWRGAAAAIREGMNVRRTRQDPVVVNLGIEPVEKPEEGRWVDDIHG